METKDFSVELNKKIGGSSNSQHCQGNAADFKIPGIDIVTVYNDIISGNINFTEDFDQLIHEFNSWIHISRSHTPRNQKLKAFRQNKQTVYEYVDNILTWPCDFWTQRSFCNVQHLSMCRSDKQQASPCKQCTSHLLGRCKAAHAESLLFLQDSCRLCVLEFS